MRDPGPRFFGGCISCDDRPEAYFIRTKYHRGLTWHFDDEADLAQWELEHLEHAGSWSLRKVSVVV